MRAILVFGGTGFLGSSLVKFLSAQNIKVIIYKHKKKLYFSKKLNKNLIYISSFNKNLLKKYKIETILHLASKVFSKSNNLDDFYDINIKLTKKIIQFAKLLRVKQFIFVSTGSIFSKKSNNGIFDENSIPTPNTYYGLFKYMAEKLVEIEFQKTSIKSCIIIFPSIFGMNHKGGVVDTFYKLAKNNRSIKVFSNGNKFRNLLHISSAVDILYLVYKNRTKLLKHEIFMAGSKNSLKLIDIARLLIQFTRSKSNIITTKKTLQSDFDVKISTLKAKRLLGFKPLSIKDGLKKFVDNND